jgi:hypothetical protein
MRELEVLATCRVKTIFFLPGKGWNWLESSGFVGKGLGEKLKVESKKEKSKDCGVWGGTEGLRS